MQAAVYAHTSSASIPELGSFETGIFVLLGAWLLVEGLTALWGRSERRSRRLPALVWALGMLWTVSCTEIPRKPHGVWGTDQGDAKVRIWSSGEAEVHVDGQDFQLRRRF